MTERKGIEIDYCPTCRGVWLDRGELDKFIQQAEQQSQAMAQLPPTPAVPNVPLDAYAQASYTQASYTPTPAGNAPRYGMSEEEARRYRERSYDGRDYDDDDRHYHRYGKRKKSFWGEIFDFD